MWKSCNNLLSWFGEQPQSLYPLNKFSQVLDLTITLSKWGRYKMWTPKLVPKVDRLLDPLIFLLKNNKLIKHKKNK